MKDNLVKVNWERMYDEGAIIFDECISKKIIEAAKIIEKRLADSAASYFINPNKENHYKCMFLSGQLSAYKDILSSYKVDLCGDGSVFEADEAIEITDVPDFFN